MKVVVYTAIFGGYDHVRAPLNQNPDAQYVLFTDAPASAPGVDVRVMKPKYNRRKSAREVKVMAHRYLPDADYTIWVDGWLQLICDPFALLPFLGDNDIAMEKHRERDCIYREAEEVIRVKKVISPKYPRAQVNRYRAEGFPEHYGLTASYLTVRRNTDKMAELENLWWHEIDNGCDRDQVSFFYCLWKMNMQCSILPHGQGKFYRSFKHARSY